MRLRRLCASAPPRLCASAPLRLCASAPLRLRASAPLRGASAWVEHLTSVEHLPRGASDRREASTAAVTDLRPSREESGLGGGHPPAPLDRHRPARV